MTFDNIINVGLIISVIGFLIIYFGKVSLKSKKELTKDNISEILNGLIFISGQPLMSVSIILFSWYGFTTWDVFIASTLTNKGLIISSLFFFFLQPIIVRHYSEKLAKFQNISKSFNEILISISVISPVFLFFLKIYFLFVPSLVFSFFALTFACIFFNLEKKDVKIKLVYLSKEIFAEVIRVGEEFIDIKVGKKFSTINKSQIQYLEELSKK
jgi:uncharacterized membrane protein